jgi:hypothetical protein
MHNLLFNPVLARGGGGGSGGGGGGGGSVLIMVGYLPMHFLGAKLLKVTSPLVANLIVWPIGLIYGGLLVAGLHGLGAICAFGALLGCGAGLYGWFDKFIRATKKTRQAIVAASKTDGAWDETKLKARAEEVFYQYQADWGNNDVSKADSYMTPRYLYHAELMIAALIQIDRQNVVANPTIQDLQIIDMSDSLDNDGDSYLVAIQARADDQLYDTATSKLLFRDQSSFTEFWRFERSGNTWLLAEITQATQDIYRLSKELRDFAAQNKYCFSPDWGWLLLPQRGQLFNQADFGHSDINNHVIGVYHDVIIQLYNYLPYKSKEKPKNYLVAQVSLPKSYGNIVVRKKRRLELFGLKGMTRVSMEWKDFNSRYEVWATDMERVTSFELLHPAYMVKLQELPFEVNIEVVDNIVYLYSAKVPATANNYQIMLDILAEAFKQMRL